MVQRHIRLLVLMKYFGRKRRREGEKDAACRHPPRRMFGGPHLAPLVEERGSWGQSSVMDVMDGQPVRKKRAGGKC